MQLGILKRANFTAEIHTCILLEMVLKWRSMKTKT